MEPATLWLQDVSNVSGPKGWNCLKTIKTFHEDQVFFCLQLEVSFENSLNQTCRELLNVLLLHKHLSWCGPMYTRNLFYSILFSEGSTDWRTKKQKHEECSSLWIWSRNWFPTDQNVPSAEEDEEITGVSASASAAGGDLLVLDLHQLKLKTFLQQRLENCSYKLKSAKLYLQTKISLS